MDLLKIKVERAKKQMSQNDVAEALGLSSSGYSFKEQGRTDFTLPEVQKMAEIFGLSDAEIIEIFFRRD